MEKTQSRESVYAFVTNRVIALLQQNIIPWKQPWVSSGVPHNGVTKKPYRGINLLLLASLQYPVSRFLTFLQIKQLGGSVKRGEKGAMVVYWHRQAKSEDEQIEEESIMQKSRAFLRFYTVFNISQCEGLPEKMSSVESFQHEVHRESETIIAGMPNPPTVQWNGGDAYYMHSLDLVNMPLRERFHTENGYYSTFFHELAHSTGHISRLNRKEIVEGNHNKTAYSIEELVAEITSCMLMNICGLENDVTASSTSYIHSWLRQLQHDHRFVILASTRAQVAVDYILNNPRT